MGVVLFPPDALRLTAARMEDSNLDESMIWRRVSICVSQVVIPASQLTDDFEAML